MRLEKLPPPSMCGSLCPKRNQDQKFLKYHQNNRNLLWQQTRAHWKVHTHITCYAMLQHGLKDLGTFSSP
eukprot:2969338-Amphidinium_carterae.2